MLSLKKNWHYAAIGLIIVAMFSIVGINRATNGAFGQAVGQWLFGTVVSSCSPTCYDWNIVNNNYPVFNIQAGTSVVSPYGSLDISYPQGAFDYIQLSCSGLPSGATCTFNPNPAGSNDGGFHHNYFVLMVSIPQNAVNGQSIFYIVSSYQGSQPVRQDTKQTQETLVITGGASPTPNSTCNSQAGSQATTCTDCNGNPTTPICTNGQWICPISGADCPPVRIYTIWTPENATSCSSSQVSAYPSNFTYFNSSSDCSKYLSSGSNYLIYLIIGLVIFIIVMISVYVEFLR